MQRQNIQSAYEQCLKIAKAHYENFPTASLFLNHEQRMATAAIYAFARTADDIADEGSLDIATRLQYLDEFRQKLSDIYQGKLAGDPVFIALADTVERFELPELPLADLLRAFRMDVEKTRYADFTELLQYCRYSANPIGELVLRLHNKYTPENKTLSDRICTALQLINFIQDIAEDYQQRNRIYIPLDEIRQYSIDENILAQRMESVELESLVMYQLNRGRDMLLDGVRLVDHLEGRLRLVIALTISSGLKMCDKLQTRPHWYLRPTLGKLDWVKIGLNALYFRTIRSRAKIHITAQ